jgi:RHS repeat-associated protein
MVLSNRFDTLLRRTNLAISVNARSSTYFYDAASRLRVVSDGTNPAGYSYIANSALVGQVAFTNNGTLSVTTTKQWDKLNRLTSVSSASIATLSSGYTYNTANQRTKATEADGSYWLNSYDGLGQVTSGKKYWSDNTLVAGQQFEYNFDDIGNRTLDKLGGNNLGQNLRSVHYTNNTLNQITGRDVPGYSEVIGSANSNATVTLWGDNGSYSPTERKEDYFWGELPVNNPTGAVWLTITNLAVLQHGTNTDIVASSTGSTFIKRTPEAFAYDADGNPASNRQWNIAWDAENRVASFEEQTPQPGQSNKLVTCVYDDRGRRLEKDVWSEQGGGLSELITRTRFIYDGWNVVAALDWDGTPLYSFTWGTDLSGSMQGAGGICGLLSMTVYATTNAGTYFYHYDGNGNVMALLNATNGAVAAQYSYGPFGELIRATGPLAQVNPFLFSTKFYDWETGFCYYGYRYYDPSGGRWLSRDPANERGGLNLYAFVANDALRQFDKLGLSVGTISAPVSQSFWSGNIIGGRGWKIRLRWTPPKGFPCCRCSEAVWVQRVSWSGAPLLGSMHLLQDWKVDWDESNYDKPQKQSELWECGKPLANYMDMWDDPEVYSVTYLYYGVWDFRAKSYVKCLKGQDEGKIYGTVDWHYTVNGGDISGGVDRMQ